MTGTMFTQPKHPSGQLATLNFDASRVIGRLGKVFPGLEGIEFVNLRLGLEGQTEEMTEGRFNVIGSVNGLLKWTQGGLKVI